VGPSDLPKRATPSDLQTLLRSSAEGNTDAFRAVVDSHQQYAFALAFRIVCDEENARDVVQEAFIRVWRHLPRYDARAKFTTWLYTIVTHLAVDRLRVEQRRSGEERLDDAHEAAGGPPLEEEITNRDLAATIKRIAGDLPVKQRLVFVLRDLEDRTLEEIGGILGMSAGAVRTNLCYARRTIRERMRKYDI
jgi:RNA polymerase sigma-70 factor (ECF subfamily)